MKQPDSEKQAEQAPVVTPLKVRTSLKAGQGGGNGSDPNQFIDPTDPSYTSVGVSGNHPMEFGLQP